MTEGEGSGKVVRTVTENQGKILDEITKDKSITVKKLKQKNLIEESVQIRADIGKFYRDSFLNFE